MIDKHWAVVAKETLTLLAEESAILTLNGIGINEQVKQLKAKYPGQEEGITRGKLVNLRKHPKYKEILIKEAENKINTGQLLGMAKLGENAVVLADCIVSEAKSGNARAAIAGLQLLNHKDSEDGHKQAQAINITLASDITKEVK